MIILIMLLILFLSSTILLGWYCYKLTNKLFFLSDSLEDLDTRLKEFDEHVNFIHELEMFYGDETLKNLIRHSRDLRNYMKKFKETIELAEDNEQEETDDKNEQEESDNSETDEDEEEQEKFVSPSGKTIFHQGS
jgi:hypothetical protein